MTKSKVFALVVGVLLAWPRLALAQMAHETMPVVVLPDRVTIGAEYVKRCIDLPNRFVVAAGQTATLPTDSTWDCIEVGGKLVTPPTAMTVRFTHFIILPGGDFEDQAACGVSHAFVVRDVPIDLTRDPFQWGNGIINFGRRTHASACPRTPKVEATASLLAGALTIPLPTPANWRVGDEILVEDTAPPSGAIYPTRNNEARRETKKTITAISGTGITLSAGLDFEHSNIVDPQGLILLRPRVLNLTHNIVVRSENPAGTPGHTVDIGMGATWDLRDTRFEVLGRTKAIPLDDTVLASGHLGLNQRGKYAVHHHHVQSCPTCVDKGNVYIGQHGGGKSGLTLHQTSDTLVEGNIAIDFDGAGFVTEDGYEVRNVFRQNFAAYNSGHLLPSQFVDPSENVKRNCPFCEGDGFWFRGVMNTFDGNEAWNNGDAGFLLLNQQQPASFYPSVPGGPPDTILSHYTDRPVACSGNVVASNGRLGWEVWGVGRSPCSDLVAANNNNAQVLAANSENIALYFLNPKILCPMPDGHPTGATGIHASKGYVSELVIEQGGYIGACSVGISDGGGIGVDFGPGIRLSGPLTLQNEINIEKLPRGYVQEAGVLHRPLGALPPKYLQFDDLKVWDGVGPLPAVAVPYGLPARAWQRVITNWQGTGKDYRLVSLHSLGSNPEWYSAPYPYNFGSPVVGLTVEQSWDRYGLAPDADMIRPSEAKVLEGVIGGIAREGAVRTLGPPRAILTFPTMRSPAVVENGQTEISVVNTGDPNPALVSTRTCRSVDGQDPTCGDADNDERSFLSDQVAPGTHEVQVWRTTPTFAVLAGSLYTSCYYVDAPTPNVSCGTPAPPTTVAVPNVLNQTEAAATASLVGVGLIKGKVTSATNPAPIGQVISQLPVAATQVLKGSAVDLVLSSGPVITPPVTTIYTFTCKPDGTCTLVKQ